MQRRSKISSTVILRYINVADNCDVYQFCFKKKHSIGLCKPTGVVKRTTDIVSETRCFCVFCWLPKSRRVGQLLEVIQSSVRRLQWCMLGEVIRILAFTSNTFCTLAGTTYICSEKNLVLGMVHGRKRPLTSVLICSHDLLVWVVLLQTWYYMQY